MVHACRARVFGLVRRGEPISPHEHDLIAMLFGFEELALPRHGHRERDVRVALCPVAEGPSLPPRADECTVQGEGVWLKRPGRATVATLARLVRDRDVAGLQALAPAVAAGIGQAAATRAVVLVQHLRHGLALAELLPGWPLLAARSGVNPRGLTAAQLQVVEAGWMAWDAQPTHAIVTATGLQALELKDIDVVIRADAGDALPPLPYGKPAEIGRAH